MGARLKWWGVKQTMLKKLWVVKDLQGPSHKQANVLAATKEQAIILFLMKINPKKYPDQETARAAKDTCFAVAVINIYTDD